MDKECEKFQADLLQSIKEMKASKAVIIQQSNVKVATEAGIENLSSATRSAALNPLSGK